MHPFCSLEHNYNQYVATFRSIDGKLPEMMKLKLHHTKEVVRNAMLIAEGERFSALESFTAKAAALLHDTGRYEQLKRYNTFRDSDSIDHAVFSYEIVKEKGWLTSLDQSLLPQDGLNSVGGAEGVVEAIESAVLWHNRREVPERKDDSEKTSLVFLASHTVRDADKLDIFRVLEERIKTTDWRKDRTAFWNLSLNDDPSEDVVFAVKNSSSVAYNSIRSLSDFILIQVGWMICGLNFTTSRKLCRERGHLAFRRSFLKELTSSAHIDEICDIAEKKLSSDCETSLGS